MKASFAQELLARTDLDHIFVVFAEAHKAGHFLWKYMDPAHPDHVAAEPYLRDSLLGIYQLLDGQLANLAEHLTERDNLIIFSDHGMQANYRGYHFIAPLLQRLGLCGSEHASHHGDVASQPLSPGNATGRMRSAVSALIKGIAPVFIKRTLRRKFGAASRVDWSRTRVFQLPTDRNSYLRVNLRGREPEGTVERGKEYGELLARIESEFRALVNAETGEPAVEEVFRVHELYPSPRVEDLPDLAILWRSDAPIKSMPWNRRRWDAWKSASARTAPEIIAPRDFCWRGDRACSLRSTICMETSCRSRRRCWLCMQYLARSTMKCHRSTSSLPTAARWRHRRGWLFWRLASDLL